MRSRALSHVFSLFSTRDRVTHFHLELLQCKKECVSWPGERSIALTYLAQRGKARSRHSFPFRTLTMQKGVRELAGRTQHRTHLSCPERRKARSRHSFRFRTLTMQKGVRELAGRTHVSCPERRKASKLSSSGKITI